MDDVFHALNIDYIQPSNYQHYLLFIVKYGPPLQSHL
jgi:hypothetical protein